MVGHAVYTKAPSFPPAHHQATAHRTAHCVALCDCDLAILTAHDLMGAMNNFQESAMVVRERAVKRLKELQTAGQAQVRKTPSPARMMDEEALGCPEL